MRLAEPRFDPSALHPSGTDAAIIERVWSVFLWVCVVVFVLVMLALLFAIVRSRPSSGQLEPRVEPGPERALLHSTGLATAATVVTLIGLLVVSSLGGRALHGAPPHEPLSVKIAGQQWWWRIEYLGKLPSESAVTANELHVPVNQPVKLLLGSMDVIHSFWVPELAGKMDLIPGRNTELVIRAERPGVYRGQCAEFCGAQHAYMGLLVIAEPAADFARWLAAARAPATPPPANSPEARGQQVFMAAGCPLCHAIAGTDAAGSTAPDLTHLAGRRTIAAGALTNTRDHLQSWILDPQAIKTGNYMPANTIFRSGDLPPLIAYLESLK
jgi:cytochrome c oxidase subunit II